MSGWFEELKPIAEGVVGIEPSESWQWLIVDDLYTGIGQESFLSEARRVAKPGAWLVVHDHWFMGQIEGDDEFGKWVRDVYLDRDPPPPRDRSWRPPDNLGTWQHAGWEQYEHRIQFD